MRRLFLFLLFIPCLLLYGAQSQGEASAPNPADLQSGWWDYYNVDKDTLVKRKQATQDVFQKIQKDLPQEVRYRLQPAFDQVLIKLQLYIDLKSKPLQPLVQPPREEKRLSYDEWLGLIRQALEKEKELVYLQLQLDLTESSLNSGGQYVDTRFLAYLKEDPNSPMRLENGLSIMQGRFSLAIETLQAAQLKASIANKKLQLASLKDEAVRDFSKVDFQTVGYEDFESRVASARTAENASYSQFFILYEDVMAAEFEGEALDQRMIDARMDYEIARIQTIFLEMQQLLVGIEKKQVPITRKELQGKIGKWGSMITELEQEIPNWEASGEFLLSQSLVSEQARYGQQAAAENIILKIQRLKDAIFSNRLLTKVLDHEKTKVTFGFFEKIAAWWSAIPEFFKKHLGWFSKTLFKIGEIPVTFWGIIKAIIVIIAFYFAGKLSSRGVVYFGEKQKRIKKTSIYVLSRFTQYFIVIFGLMLSGAILGFDPAVLGYITGAVVIWIGFGLQNIFFNFISGMIVLFTRSIRINDFVELETGEKGTVLSINLRTSTLQTLWGSELIVPNSEFVGKKFTNHSLTLYVKRVHVPFRVALDEDMDKVSTVVKAAAKTVSITSESKEPELWITGYGENYIKMELVVWANGFLRGELDARQPQYYWALDTALRENNIKIPIVPVLQSKEQ